MEEFNRPLRSLEQAGKNQPLAIKIAPQKAHRAVKPRKSTQFAARSFEN
jgi:hypothetical protein